jgi:small subunit ribosomal protein S1
MTLDETGREPNIPADDTSEENRPTETPEVPESNVTEAPDTPAEPVEAAAEAAPEPEVTLEPEVAPESEVAPEPEVTSESEAAAEAESEPEVTPEPEAASEPEAAPELEAAPEPGVTPEPEAATPAPAPTPEPAKPASRFTRGQLLQGKISATTPTAVTVDLGEGDEGVIPGRELERMSRQMIEELTVGMTIDVYVVNPSDHEGRTILSVNRALEELDWKSAEQYRESQEPYEGKIAGYNKGGLIVRFGRLRGFVPRSQISEERLIDDNLTPEEMYSKSVNDPIIVKVTEVDRARNRLILSERAAIRETREKRKEDLIHRLSVGQIMTGRVVSIEDFGAFVDIGGAEGLVHLTEITWKHINRPDEVLQRGKEVKVEVISIDPDRKRIGLSMKRQEIDPWDEVATTYEVGQLVQGTITKLTKFGAFARLVDAPDIEGLIHISELSDQRVNHPKEVVQEGDKLTLRVVKVDVKNRRLGLSLKRVHSAEYLDRDMQQYLAPDAGTETSSTPDEPADDADDAADPGTDA